MLSPWVGQKEGQTGLCSEEIQTCFDAKSVHSRLRRQTRSSLPPAADQMTWQPPSSIRKVLALIFSLTFDLLRSK